MSREKAKGSAAERAVVEYLRGQGFPHAERRIAGSSADRGDISGVVGVVVEVKNQARTELGEWLTGVRLKVANAGAVLGFCWHKRRGKGSPGDWYVTMDGATAVALLRSAGYGDPPEGASGGR
jgi:hypothetical protein